MLTEIPYCFIYSGYAERQKMMAVMIEGFFVEVNFTPQNVGGGETRLQRQIITTYLYLHRTRTYTVAS